MTAMGYEWLGRADDWRRAAKCRGMDLAQFFPGRGGVHREALLACSVCPVRRECLDDALADERVSGATPTGLRGVSARTRLRVRQGKLSVDEALLVSLDWPRFGSKPGSVRDRASRGDWSRPSKERVPFVPEVRSPGGTPKSVAVAL